MSNLQPTPEAEIDTLLFAYAEAVAATYQRYADGEIKTAKNAMELTVAHQELKQALADLLNRSRIDELKSLPLDVHISHATHTSMCISIRARNARIAELQTPPATEEVAE